MSLAAFDYKVYNRTYLNSVRWFFGYSFSENDFVKRFISLIQEGGFEVVKEEEKALMVKKQGVTILANSELLILNISADSYRGFEILKPELLNVLSVLERLSIKELNTITCSKENIYQVKKTELKKDLTENIFAGVLFKGELLLKPFFMDTRDGFNVVVSRMYTDSVLEAKMQLLVSVFASPKMPISMVFGKLSEVDRVSYDAFMTVISDGLIKIMES